ncbi:Zn-ribbon domain-containing OB-fold protein [Actinomadura viridis]|uniref:Zn-ribbon domain-containing OB-fold protein n=1 Tax=Actinomadura viridis TaxID=58110 RepID=UPI0036C35467
MDQPRPVPAPSPLTAPYWAACGRGELALQRCAGCARFVHFPEPACPFCGGADLPYETVGGRGTVHTFSVVHRSFLPGFEPPYVIAWIDLDLDLGLDVPRPGGTPGGGTPGDDPAGGPVRVFGDVTGCPPEDVRVGMRVEVHFRELEGFGPIPHWRPAP